MNAQYTLSRQRGNTGGSNEALTAGNDAQTLAEFDYDNGYNNFDVRHTFNLSVLYTCLRPRPRAHATGLAEALLGGWDVGGIVNARSGLPIDVRITRPDIVYVDAAGNVFNNPAAGRTAVINTPGGGASRNVRRPDLVPGVDPFINDGGLLFLNPAAFATPKPGTFGNLERNSIHGPGFSQVDMVMAKRFALRRRDAERRVPRRGLQPVQPRQLREPGGDAAERAADQRHDRSEQGAARSAVHRRRRRHVRHADAARSAGPSASARRVRCSSRSASTSNEERPAATSRSFRSIARILEARSRKRAGSFFADRGLRPASI